MPRCYLGICVYGGSLYMYIYNIFITNNIKNKCHLRISYTTCYIYMFSK
uniref:Uncharacterized protein n=1 Tax=Histiona aroides TaxID=392300 RepID=M4QKS6_HISAR|nr:hypothetical protein L075_p035 [Histiona aroides]AGH24068.1 hypothetical protein [Histiona aroides]